MENSVRNNRSPSHKCPPRRTTSILSSRNYRKHNKGRLNEIAQADPVWAHLAGQIEALTWAQTPRPKEGRRSPPRPRLSESSGSRWPEADSWVIQRRCPNVSTPRHSPRHVGPVGRWGTHYHNWFGKKRTTRPSGLLIEPIGGDILFLALIPQRFPSHLEVARPSLGTQSGAVNYHSAENS